MISTGKLKAMIATLIKSVEIKTQTITTDTTQDRITNIYYVEDALTFTFISTALRKEPVTVKVMVGSGDATLSGSTELSTITAPQSFTFAPKGSDWVVIA